MSGNQRSAPSATTMSRATLLIALAVAAMASPLLKKSDTDVAVHGERVGWVSAPRRSTMDIIWNCLSVFMICSWKCMHHNLPTPAEGQAGYCELMGVPCWPTLFLARKWARQFGYMAVVCLAPELVVAIAFEDFLAARYALRSLQEDLPIEVTRNYTMAHAFCAQMGGFAIRQLSSPLIGKPNEIDHVVCSLSRCYKSTTSIPRSHLAANIVYRPARCFSRHPSHYKGGRDGQEQGRCSCQRLRTSTVRLAFHPGHRPGHPGPCNNRTGTLHYGIYSLRFSHIHPVVGQAVRCGAQNCCHRHHPAWQARLQKRGPAFLTWT